MKAGRPTHSRDRFGGMRMQGGTLARVTSEPPPGECGAARK